MTPTSTDERRRRAARRAGRAAAVLILAAAAFAGADDPTEPLLRFLGLTASPESMDYVVNKTQFQLHTLLTEQRHPKTWALSERIAQDTEAGLRMLFSVDEDVSARLAEWAARPDPLVQLTGEIDRALVERRRIYIYGCGATGRLAKQMESGFWRPFWRRLKARPELWAKIRKGLAPEVEDQLIGEMTGADRALISSLEGFEDLPLIGRLQLQDRGVKRGDVVIAVTEGGETSSVIGTILAALDQWKGAPGYNAEAARRRLYFVYNNPDDRLRPFVRSRTVLDEPGITKINLTTGPQAITGSTRMQATTIETYVLGCVLETAAERFLRRLLPARDMERAGFDRETGLPERLRRFPALLDELKRRVPELARLTDLEARTYARGRFSTYYAESGLLTVFIDSTERSPTFRLFPLDTVKEPARRCWIQVWTAAADGPSAWRAFLGRPFRGLRPEFYRPPFEAEIDDPYLKAKALASLENAGADQADLYDFSFAGANRGKRAPKKGDLGIMVRVGGEAAGAAGAASSFQGFSRIVLAGGAEPATIVMDTSGAGAEASKIKPEAKPTGPVLVRVRVDASADPFGVRAQVALKMLLNAHSTAVMAKLGKVVGNTMTNVSPSNLKLIGRATYLTMLHVNDVLGRPAWNKTFGPRKPVDYGETNAVLFDSIAYMKALPREAGQSAEVPLTIIRILESLRRKQAVASWEALAIYKKSGLADYLAHATDPIQ